MNKLEGLPKIYYINLVEATDRNQYMLDMFDKYNITNFERYEATRPKKSNHILLTSPEFGCLQSHIEVIKLIASGSDEYAIVMEDDSDISVVEQWEFTWKDIFNNLPKFDIIQLFRHQLGEKTGLALKKWDRKDKSTTTYMITKSYAKEIMTRYNKGEESFSYFKSLSRRVGPVADFSLFVHGNSYSMCIFNIKDMPSQINPTTDFWEPWVKNIKYINDLFSKKIDISDIIK